MTQFSLRLPRLVTFIHEFWIPPCIQTPGAPALRRDSVQDFKDAATAGRAFVCKGLNIRGFLSA
jgi:hypothetical protein